MKITHCGSRRETTMGELPVGTWGRFLNIGDGVLLVGCWTTKDGQYDEPVVQITLFSPGGPIQQGPTTRFAHAVVIPVDVEMIVTDK